MKNILFATTALVATAGFAQAEVTGSGPGTINITGSAEMGIFGGERFTTDFLSGGITGTRDIEAQFHTDIDVNFSMEGTADNGLTFGASVDLDEADGDGRCDVDINLVTPSFVINGRDLTATPFAGCDVRGFSRATGDDSRQGGETIFISGGGAILTMGDTNGAFDQAMREVSYAGGSIGDNEEHIAWGGYGNNGLDGFYDGQIARFDYSFDTVTASISAEIDDGGDESPVWGLGVRYQGDLSGVALGVGLGYQAVESLDTSIVGISLDAGFSNGVTTGFTYTVADFDGTEGTHGALGIAYEMNALAIGVNYGRYTFDGDETSQGFALAATYDMGGGLSAQLGYGHSTATDVITATGDDESIGAWSLGLAMSF